jgi:uncharacterized coiled-coil DUF342 family protein
VERDRLLAEKIVLTQQLQQLQQENKQTLEELMESRKMIDDVNQTLTEKDNYLGGIEAEITELKTKKVVKPHSLIAKLRYIFRGKQ